MKVLNLAQNEIGAAGARALAEALKENVVSRSLSYIFRQTRCRSQTLVSLDLRSNEISEEGARELAEALRKNKVSQPFLPSTSELPRP